MRIIYKTLVMILTTFILYYFMLPTINLSNPEFWFFITLIFFIATIINYVFNMKKITSIINNKEYKLKCIYVILFGFIVFILIFLINLINLPIFRAKTYANRINVQTGEFVNDIKPVDFNKLALLDKKSSVKLGDKVMGQMTDLVSQFEVSNLYTQINYKDKILRVTPLEYANVIKYFTNMKNGIPGYITVDSVTGESKLNRLNKGMHYMPSSLFFENLYRKLRFSYPFTNFGEINFEIDDNGNPYWIVETLKYSGIGLRREVNGIIILNPIDGKSIKYDINDIPTWVDHVYSTNLIIEQLNNWGLYKKGYLNSLFGQKDVVKTSEGYNYLVINNDIYLYTGITSVSNDDANIGFVLSNLRTKETKLYNVPGTIENSAMDSAEGQVQQMNYTATFPLLINLNNNPTYVLSLKDSSGLVKMYAFIDYTDYQKVVVTDSSLGIKTAATNYLDKNISQEVQTKEIIIDEITSANISGNTYYYIKSNDEVYRAQIKINQKILPFLKKNDKIKIEFSKSDVWEILKIVE